MKTFKEHLNPEEKLFACKHGNDPLSCEECKEDNGDRLERIQLKTEISARLNKILINNEI